MIGVAFALRDTFGKSDDIEGTAFARAVRAFARSRRLAFDEAGFDAVARDHLTTARPADLRAAFASALRPHLVRDVDDVLLEATFRSEAARLVGERFVPYGDVANALRELGLLNVPCAGLGGGWPSIEQRKAAAVGFAGPIVFTEDHGVEPTSPAAFARLAETLRLPAANVWFVGTDPVAEILPAAAVGMHTIWIDRGDATYPADRVRPDATVATFGAVLDVLGEPYTRGLLSLRHLLHTSLEWRPGRTVPGRDPATPTEP